MRERGEREKEREREGGGRRREGSRMMEGNLFWDFLRLDVEGEEENEWIYISFCNFRLFLYLDFFCMIME